MRVPINKFFLSEAECKYLQRALRWGECAQGLCIEKFERAFADAHNKKYAISVCNGTAALHLGVKCLPPPKCNYVWLPAMTMIATAYAVLYEGHDIQMVDANPETWVMDRPDFVDNDLVMPVHLYGATVKQFKGCSILEDAAEAMADPGVGWGDMTAFSLYANKLISTGEGGMLLTDNKDLADRARYLRNMCFEEQRFLHREIGYNYRMSNIQAALGLGQMATLRERYEKKKQIRWWYTYGLEGSGVTLQRPGNGMWMFGFLLPTIIERESFRKALADWGIETRTFFVPLHKQPCIPQKPDASFPVAENLYERGVLLPSGLGMTREDVNYVCDIIKEVLDGCS